MMAFLNPYAWVGHQPRKPGPLGDAAPSGHDRARDGQVHGHITVTFEAVTPLLILDDSARTKSTDNAEHFVYDVPSKPDGTPLVPLSGLKGALRQAYEAVTASRFGAFSDHSSRLGRRLAANKGAGLTPARLTQNDDGEWIAELLEGKVDDPQANAPTFVRPAFVPCAAIKKLAGLDADDPLNSIESYEKYMALHGVEVNVKFGAISHRKNGNIDFVGWRAVEIDLSKNKTAKVPRDTWDKRDVDDFEAQGRLFLTGPQTAAKKHEERIFFFHSADGARTPALLPFDTTAQQTWHDVMRSYADAHDLEKPSDHLKFNEGAMKDTRFAAHLVQPHRRVLRDGMLVYLRLKEENGTKSIAEVHPVAIGRELFPESPAAITRPYLRPLASAEEASPADRLFGWVAHEKTTSHGDAAHRGHIRLAEVDTTGASVEILDPAVPLKILGGPKPQQFLFYLAKLPAPGAKLTPSSSTGFTKADTLRGRKFYWHHTDGPTATKRAKWSTQERSRQNRSISGWIKPSSRLVLRIEVKDASEADLGGLLWMLEKAQGENPCHLRLGYGKPLGFGSVKVVSVDSSLESTTDLRTRLAQLRPHRSTIETSPLVAAFLAAYGKTAETGEADLPEHLREYLTIGRGKAGYDIHYPRNTDEDKGFKWFMDNARSKPAQALPLTLATDPRLKPIAPTENRGSRPGDNRGHHQGRPHRR